MAAPGQLAMLMPDRLDPLTHRQTLFALYAVQQWECLAPPKQGDHYARGYFYQQVWGILKGLNEHSRKTIMYHLDWAREHGCFVCGNPDTTDDHIIARKRGGPNDLRNALRLCQRCNSSKGTKDLLAWWLQDRKAVELPRNILCLYCRIVWQTTDVLDEAPPSTTTAFLYGRLLALPSFEHITALYGAAFAASAIHKWERRVHA
jgi:hypothetical protein